MAITLARVDDRVIHGQTMTRWGASRPVNSILVISDKVAADEFRKKALKVAVGASIKLGIYNIEQGLTALEKAHASAKNFFIIADSVAEFAKLKRAGGDFGSVLNIGNLSGTRPGTKNLGHAICINDDDVADFDYLESTGVKLEFQMTPEDPVKTWGEYKAKYQAA